MLLCARRISASLPCGLQLDNASPVLTGPAISSHLPGFCRLRPCGHSTGSWAHGWPRHPSRSRTASFPQALVRPRGCVGSGPRPSAGRSPWPLLFVPGPVRPAVVGSPSRRPDCASRRIVGSSSSDCPFLAVAQSPSRWSSAVTYVSRAPGPSPAAVSSAPPGPAALPTGSRRLSESSGLLLWPRRFPPGPSPQASRPTPARPQWYSAALATRLRSPCLHLPPGPMGPPGSSARELRVAVLELEVSRASWGELQLERSLVVPELPSLLEDAEAASRMIGMKLSSG